jgi:hypothetical protein
MVVASMKYRLLYCCPSIWGRSGGSFAGNIRKKIGTPKGFLLQLSVRFWPKLGIPIPQEGVINKDEKER